MVYLEYGYNVARGPAQQHVPHKERLKARGAAPEPSVRPWPAVPEERQEAAWEPRHRIPKIPRGGVCERLLLARPQALRQVPHPIHPCGVLAAEVCPEQRARPGEYIGPPGPGLQGGCGVGVLHHRPEQGCQAGQHSGRDRAVA